MRLLCYSIQILLTILFDHAFFVFFLIIDLHFLIHAITAQTFNSVGELVIATGITTKEKKAEIVVHPLIAEAKIFFVLFTYHFISI